MVYLLTIGSIGFASSVTNVFISRAALYALYPNDGTYYVFLDERQPCI